MRLAIDPDGCFSIGIDILRAAMASDALAIGAAILPLSERLLPSKTALMNASRE